MSVAVEPWEGWPACPCGCEVTGLKLAAKTGHLARVCECVSCRNRRNQKRGKRGEYNRHRRLRGGAKFTPNDELGYVYSIEFCTQDKAGAQIPASFQKFVGLEWTRHALKQAMMTIPEGVVAYPALYLEPPGGGWWLVVKGA